MANFSLFFLKWLKDMCIFIFIFQLPDFDFSFEKNVRFFSIGFQHLAQNVKDSSENLLSYLVDSPIRLNLLVDDLPIWLLHKIGREKRIKKTPQPRCLPSTDLVWCLHSTTPPSDFGTNYITFANAAIYFIFLILFSPKILNGKMKNLLEYSGQTCI